MNLSYKRVAFPDDTSQAKEPQFKQTCSEPTCLEPLSGCVIDQTALVVADLGQLGI